MPTFTVAGKPRQRNCFSITLFGTIFADCLSLAIGFILGRYSKKVLGKLSLWE